MKVVEDYLRKDLGMFHLSSWEEIRTAYMERAIKLVAGNYQSPSYRHSLVSQAGNRAGKIIANINDYTRDQHDLAAAYERAFARAYLPRYVLPLVTSSGMAALTTVVAALHRIHGMSQTALMGRHSYFQNQELLTSSFDRVITAEETDVPAWKTLIEREKPSAIFADTLCNVSCLTVTPVIELARYLSSRKRHTYLVVDNSLLGAGFPWTKLLRLRSRKLTIIGWESLNKFYQYGLDRTTGGIVWASNDKTRVALFHARMAAGTILSDIHCAMLPTPNMRVMRRYLSRIEENATYLTRTLRLSTDPSRVQILRANTEYGFNGAQIVVSYTKPRSYRALQTMISRMIRDARQRGVELIAGSSFGLPNTRLYVTARKTDYAEMFFRISVGTEEKEAIRILAEVIANNL